MVLADGVRGMRFADAVMRSHETGARVALE